MADPLRDVGKILLLVGLILVGLGAFLTLAPKLPGKLGRLPGDIMIKRDNFTFYFPLATSILLSVILTLVLWVFRRR